MTTCAPPFSTHPNAETLRGIYADLTRLEHHATADIVLHAAERANGEGRYVGKQAAVAKERELIRLTGGTLVMDVQHIVADDHFGAVLGVLRAAAGTATWPYPSAGCGVSGTD